VLDLSPAVAEHGGFGCIKLGMGAGNPHYSLLGWTEWQAGFGLQLEISGINGIRCCRPCLFASVLFGAGDGGAH
jgi:hypothetical protein